MLAFVTPVVVAHLCFVPAAFVFALRAGDAMWDEALFSNAFHSVAAFAAWVLVCSVAYVAVAVLKRALEQAMDDHGVHFDRCREVTALMVSVCEVEHAHERIIQGDIELLRAAAEVPFALLLSLERQFWRQVRSMASAARGGHESEK